MPTDETAPHSKTFFQRISHFLLVAAYLWLLLSVFTLHNAVTASDWTLATHLGEVTLKALLFGKFVLIAEHLHLGKRAEHLPLVWPILIKAALFAISTVFEETGVKLPVMISVTITDASGRTLSGQTISAFYYFSSHAADLR